MNDFELNYFLNKVCLEGALNKKDYIRNIKSTRRYLKEENRLSPQKRNKNLISTMRNIGQYNLKKCFENNIGFSYNGRGRKKAKAMIDRDFRRLCSPLFGDKNLTSRNIALDQFSIRNASPELKSQLSPSPFY